MPFGIQPIHIIIILIVALLLFGPSRLPELGRSLGKGLNEFRRGTREMTQGFTDEITKPADGNSPPPPQAAQSGESAIAPTAASRFCTQCGTPNPADARFCSKCGAQLSA
jgi:sec-independent protein translocase protein TatA